MELIILSVIVAISTLLSLISLVAIKKSSKNSQSVNYEDILKEYESRTKQDIESMQTLFNQLNNSQVEMLRLYNTNVVDNIKNLKELNNKELSLITEKLVELTSSNEKKMDKLIESTDTNMQRLQQSNEKRLEEMRITVDEKLNTSLERRLNESFALISERLEAVSSGLGEMRTLASGVGDLKKVLTNVKTRGVFGEVQLNTLLEQMLAPNQYEVQAMIKPNSQDRVDFAIHFPGKDNNTVLLPVDAKFPMEDYLRLVEAMDSNDQANIVATQKALQKRIKEAAKSIKEKYINIPTTTDFAIMYLPTEGLYAEVLKCDGLVEQLQRDYKIIICGPTTISALLNSLQMGFRTLAIEKRSSEIWNMLSSFKKEFSVYIDLLTKTHKKLTEATDTIEDATKKGEKIKKQLSKVDEYEIEGVSNKQLENKD